MVSKKNQLYVILGIILLIVVIASFFVIKIYTDNNHMRTKIDSQEKTIASLSLDNTNLNNQLTKCYSDIKNNTLECYDPGQCIKNPNLAGCHKNSCNWCCFSVCTLIGCIYEK